MSTENIGIKIFGDVKELIAGLKSGEKSVNDFQKTTAGSVKEIRAQVNALAAATQEAALKYGATSKQALELKAAHDQLKGALNEVTSLTKGHTAAAEKSGSVFSELKGTFLAVSGAVAAAGGAFKFAEGVINSTDNTADLFEETVSSVKFGYEALLRTIATGDWSNLLTTMETAIDEGREYAATLDDIEERQRGQNMVDAERKNKILDLKRVMKDARNTDIVQAQAGLEILKLENKTLTENEQLRREKYSASLKKASTETGLPEYQVQSYLKGRNENSELVKSTGDYLDALVKLDKAKQKVSTTKGMDPTAIQDVEKYQKVVNEATTTVKVYSQVVTKMGNASDKTLTEVAQDYVNLQSAQTDFKEGTQKTWANLTGHLDKLTKDQVKATKDAEDEKQKAIKKTREKLKQTILMESMMLNELRGGHGSKNFSGGKYNAPMFDTGGMGTALVDPGNKGEGIKNAISGKTDVASKVKEFYKLQDAIAGASSALNQMGSQFSGLFDSIGNAFIKFKEGFTGGWKEMASTIGSVVSSAVQVVSQLFTQQTDNRLRQLDETYNVERERIESSTMNEKSKAKALDKLDKDNAKQKRALMRQQAKDQKEAAIMQAIITGALGVIQATNAAPPLDIILPILIGAMVAAQIATIISQPLPALAKGGLAYAPTIAMVGDNPGAYNDPEVISPLSKLRQYMASDEGDRQLVATVRGDDLLFVLNRAKISQNRRY